MTDTCPNCLQRDVQPRTERNDRRQTRSAYRCPTCGHAWITSRLRDAYQPAA